MNKWIVAILFLLFSTIIEAHSGIFLNLQSGFSDLSGMPDRTAPTVLNLTKHTFPALRVGIGYLHDFCPWFGFGFEAAQGYYAKYDYQLLKGFINTRSSTYEFLGVMAFHLPKNFDLYAKIGGVRHTLKVTAFPEKPFCGEHTPNRLQVSVGIAYNITPHIAVIADVSHVSGNTATIKNIGWVVPSLNEALVGIRITFF